MGAKHGKIDWPVDVTDDVAVIGLVKRVINRITVTFWAAEGNVKELDTSLGRQKLLENRQIIDSNARFRRPWYEGVTFIDPTLLAGQEYDTAGKKKAKKATKKMTKSKLKRTIGRASWRERVCQYV